MSVTVRTNHVTNPAPGSTTGFANTSGAGTWSYNTSQGQPFARFTKDAAVATTGFLWGATAISGSSGMAVSLRFWVRSSAAATLQLRNNLTNIAGATVALSANVWTEVVLENHITTIADFRLGASIASMAANSTLDFKLGIVEAGATSPNYFDGSFVDAASIIYAWDGPADASTSTATLYTPVVTTVPFTTYDPCPRVEVTISDLTPTANTVTVWCTADGRRKAVQGARGRAMVGSDFVIDYAAPLARTLTYDIEITEGVGTSVAAIPSNVTVDATEGCIQDPLIPSTAMPVYDEVGPNGEISLMDSAVKNLEYAADVSIIGVMGSPDPVGIMGQRMAAAGVPFNMVTEAAQHATDMRELIFSSPLLLIRPLPSWAGALPGNCFLAADRITEKPINEAWGGNVIEWHVSTPFVAAPSMNIVVPLWTYGDVQALWTTYQQAQTALTGKTYLTVTKSPTGA